MVHQGVEVVVSIVVEAVIKMSMKLRMRMLFHLVMRRWISPLKQVCFKTTFLIILM